MGSKMTNYVTSVEALQGLFDRAGEASIRKQSAMLHPTYQAWIARSPFAVLATTGPNGLDTSPRGDPAPLVRIRDETTLLLPERRRNNRIDSLRNILHDPHVSLIFFVPGVRETVRVNGTAKICIDPDLLAQFPMQGQLPKCIIEVCVQAAFFQCGRALQRSALWTEDQVQRRAAVPSPDDMLASLTGNEIDGVAYDKALPARQATSLY